MEDLMEKQLLNPEMMQLAETLTRDAVKFGLDLAAAVALLLVGWIVANWVRRNLRTALHKLPEFDRMVAALLSNLARYLIL